MGLARNLFTALLLATTSLSIRAESDNEKQGPTTAIDQSFTRYMLRSSLADNPDTSALCFAYFLPILNSIAEEFSGNFQKCAINERSQKNEINDKVISEHNQLDSDAKDVCDRLNSCNDYIHPLDYFDCFGEQGKENLNVLYTITEKSTAIGGELREEYLLAELAKYRCQNASERVYVESTAATYYQLDICLRTGEMPESQVTTTTATAPTTTKTSEAAITTNTSDEANTDSATVEQETTTTIPEITSPVPPHDVRDLNGRGLKILPKLQKFWSN